MEVYKTRGWHEVSAFDVDKLIQDTSGVYNFPTRLIKGTPLKKKKNKLPPTNKEQRNAIDSLFLLIIKFISFYLLIIRF